MFSPLNFSLTSIAELIARASDQRVAVFTHLTPKPGRERELLDSLESVLQSVQREHGTLVYVAHEAPTGPSGTVVIYMIFEDETALQQHVQGTTAALLSALPMLSTPPSMKRARIIGGKLSSESVAPIISVGSKIPDKCLLHSLENGRVRTMSVPLLFTNKRVALIGCPGPFSPTASVDLLGYIDVVKRSIASEQIPIYCIAVSDAYVMNAWKKDLSLGSDVTMLADPNGDFTRKMGLLTNTPKSQGSRSKSYMMIVSNGVVESFDVDDSVRVPNMRHGPDHLAKL